MYKVCSSFCDYMWLYVLMNVCMYICMQGLQESGNAAYYQVPKDLIQFAGEGEIDVSKYTQMKLDQIKGVYTYRICVNV